MKKIVLAALLFISVSMKVQAQYLRAGIAGAFNSTWLFNKDVSDAGEALDYKSTFGPSVGVEALYNFKENIGVSIGILYSAINQKYTNRVTDIHGNKNTFETEMKTNHIEIPILFRYTGESGPYFEIGPQIGIVTGAEIEGLGTTLDIKDQTASTNISGALGFGYDVDLSDNLDLTLGLRFGYGFTDISDGNGDEPTNTTTGGFHLGLAYIFGGR
jgi:opacity protein-like surface antigen